MQINKKHQDPYILKLNQRLKQKSKSSSSNTLYKLMKQESQHKMRFKTLENDNHFYTKLDHIIEYQPAKVIGQTLCKIKMLKQGHRRRKSLQQAASQPKRSYQIETKSFINGLHKRRALSNFVDADGELESKEWRGISRSNTGFVKTVTNQSEEAKSITFNLKPKQHISNFNSKPHKTKSRHSQHSSKRLLSQQSQSLQSYSKAFTTLIQQAKHCSSSIYKQQRKLHIAKQIQQKLNRHFGRLALCQKQLDDLHFMDVNSITKPERYMFSTNNFLVNLLLKNDELVKDWIEKEDKRQFRKDTIEIVNEKLIDNLISSKYLKYRKANADCKHQQKQPIQQDHQRQQITQNNSVHKLPYQPKRIRNILSIKEASSASHSLPKRRTKLVVRDQ